MDALIEPSNIYHVFYILLVIYQDIKDVPLYQWHIPIAVSPNYILILLILHWLHQLFFTPGYSFKETKVNLEEMNK